VLGRPRGFWGKLRQSETGVVEAWHPLNDHCADVAACCEALLENGILRRRLARLGDADDLMEVEVQRLSYLAALHDAGKFNLGFQRRADPAPRERVGHVGELFAILAASGSPEQRALLDALDLADVDRWSGFRLLIAAFAHHGAPISLRSPGHVPRPELWRAADGLDPIAGVRALVAAARRWFPAAGRRSSRFPDAPALQHAYAGLVTLADWVGSDEEIFPYSDEGREDRFAWARVRAREAVERLWIDPSRARNLLGGVAPVFGDVFSGRTPRAAQRSVIDLASSPGGGLVILEAETGSGKTEAALARFLALFASGEVDGLYFALPTRTAAKQIHRRIVEAVRSAFPAEHARPPVVLAVPGYHRVDDVTGQKTQGGDGPPRLAPFRVLWPDQDENRWRGWAAERPKRFLAGTVVVGTIDQVLLSGLAVSHAHLRATSLLRHLLVVDEVHASDVYMNRLLELVLERHLAAGGHALLMSATLGASARERFTGGGAARGCTSLVDAEAIPYPALVVTDARRKRQRVEKVHGAGNARRVNVEIAPVADEPGEIARRALDAAGAGARVLVLRNTVRDAVLSQGRLEQVAGDDDARLFKCEGRPAPHHARFAAEDRERLDRAIERAFGTTAPDGGCVAVATQTVQQSLDLDADLLLTDLCPMDVLLQRIGRLHRHARGSRPTGFTEPRVVVLVPATRDLSGLIRRDGRAQGPHGFGTVYQDLRILEATWRLLEERPVLATPEMNRALVERITHPEALARVVPRGSGPWADHARLVAGGRMAQAACATTNAFRWDAPYGDIGFSPELQEMVGTRLGAGDRLVAFEGGAVGPFGSRIAGLTLPAWFCKGAPDDAGPEELTVSARGLRFRFGGRRFVYDRLGVRPDAGDATHEEDRADA
jgi:CRISPR-associated endonuclease/helicase Cas3